MSNRVVREHIIALLSILGGKHSLFFEVPKSLQMVTAAMKLKDACSLEQKLWPNLDSILKSQSDVFSRSRVWMWQLAYKESWALKNWCLWTMVLEKTLESPLDCKEIEPVHPKGGQSWVFIGRTHAEAPKFWPPDEKNWLIGKDHDAGKDWGQEEKGTTEDEMFGWHHQLNGHEFE